MRLNHEFRQKEEKRAAKRHIKLKNKQPKYNSQIKYKKLLKIIPKRPRNNPRPPYLFQKYGFDFMKIE